jgi:hypothetical protein
VACLAAAYVGLALYFLSQGRINNDEGWYLYAARLVYEGSVPYRDFAFFQAPLLPYLYGLPQALFGGSIGVGRATSLLLDLFMVALGTRLSFERGGRLAGAVFLVGISSTPFAMWVLATTRTEPLSAALLMTITFLLLRRPPRIATTAGVLVAAVLLAATRASAIPVALLAAALALFRAPRAHLLALAPALVVAAIVSIPVILDPGAAWFNVYTSQADRHDQLAPAPLWGVWDHLTSRANTWVLTSTFHGLLPPLALACALGAVADRVIGSGRGVARVFPTGSVTIAAIGLVAYLPNLFPRQGYAEYFAPSFCVLYVLLAGTIGSWYRACSDGARRVAAAALAGLFLAQLPVFVSGIDARISEEESDIDQLRDVARYLLGVVPAGGRLATLDTYLAVESGLRLPRGWEMGLFSYFPREEDEALERFHLLTPDRLRQSLRSPEVAAVALSDRALGILVLRKQGPYRPFHTLSETELRQALPGLEGFHLVRVFSRYGQFRDNLYVLVRPGPLP